MNALTLSLELLEKHPFGPEPLVIMQLDGKWIVETMTSYEDMVQDGVHIRGHGPTLEKAAEDFFSSLSDELGTFEINNDRPQD